MNNPLENFIVVHEGPLRVVRACRCCKWWTMRERYSNNYGQAAGFVLGNKQRGVAIAHVRDCPGVADAIKMGETCL